MSFLFSFVSYHRPINDKFPLVFLIDFWSKMVPKCVPKCSQNPLFFAFFPLSNSDRFFARLLLKKCPKMSPKVLQKTVKFNLGALKVTFRKHQYYHSKTMLFEVQPPPGGHEGIKKTFLKQYKKHTRFFIDFWLQKGVKNEPKWSQKASKNVSKII